MSGRQPDARGRRRRSAGTAVGTASPPHSPPNRVQSSGAESKRALRPLAGRPAPGGDGPGDRADDSEHDAQQQPRIFLGDVAVVTGRAARHRPGDVEEVPRNPDAGHREHVTPLHRESILVEPTTAERRVVIEKELRAANTTLTGLVAGVPMGSLNVRWTATPSWPPAIRPPATTSP